MSGPWVGNGKPRREEGADLNAYRPYSSLAALGHSWPEGLLVLMYHAVAPPPLFHAFRGLYVTPGLLSRQVKELASIPLTTLTAWNRDRPPRRAVALTFDDAYRNLFEQGLPVLQRAKVPALTYVVASLIGKTNEWDRERGARTEPLMDRTQLNEWLRLGHEVGSHGITHRDLTQLPLQEAREEIVGSKKALEDTFGQAVRHFCYPYGRWNEAVRDIVQEAGYETATTTDPGMNTAATDLFALQRRLAGHERPWLAALLRR